MKKTLLPLLILFVLIFTANLDARAQGNGKDAATQTKMAERKPKHTDHATRWS